MNGNVEIGEKPMDGAGSDHETGINGPTHDPSQRIPRPLVEPVEEARGGREGGKRRRRKRWSKELSMEEK